MAGALAATAVVATIWVLRGRGAPPVSTPADVTPTERERPAPVAAPLAVEPERPRRPPPAVSQTVAVEQLRRAFGKARLYCQIAVQGDQLELRSTSCEDRQLAELLERSRTVLSESGILRVRCLLPHGQVVFTRDL